MNQNTKNPSIEDIFELSGIEVLHPGGFELSKRICEIIDMKDKKVLDVACGRGAFACYCAKNFGAKITGIDLSSDMVKSAVKRAKREGVEDATDFKVTDALDLPFSDGSFDVVVNECAVGLTPDPQRCLNEAVRVAKPGGYIVIHESIWLKEISEKEKKDIAKRLGTVPFTISVWKGMLKKAGVGDIWHEDWSGVEKISKIRPDRKIKNAGDIFSLREKIIIIIPRVLQGYGLRGLFYLNESNKKITPLYYNGTLGYCLITGQKSKDSKIWNEK